MNIKTFSPVNIGLFHRCIPDFLTGLSHRWITDFFTDEYQTFSPVNIRLFYQCISDFLTDQFHIISPINIRLSHQWILRLFHQWISDSLTGLSHFWISDFFTDEYQTLNTSISDYLTDWIEYRLVCFIFPEHSSFITSI